jgi:SAM-dependent methyltransferase
VRVLPTSGRNLGPFTDASFDAVLAIDSFPYVHEAGGTALVAVLLGEIHRVLRPGGDALILNLSYRNDLERDRADLQAIARELGLELHRNGTRDLRSWDGATFHLRRPHQATGRSRQP